MDLDDLRFLLQVVEHGSIQGAASRMGLSRSSLRRRLDRLEGLVGTPLLHRDAQGVRLTPAGEVVTARGRAVIAQTDELLADARKAAGQAVGRARIIEPVGLPVVARMHALLATHRANPDLHLDVRTVEAPLQCLDERFDVMLHGGSAPPRDAWLSKVLGRTTIRCFASPAYLDDRGRPQRAEDLDEHELIAWRGAAVDPMAWPLRDGGELPAAPWLISNDLPLLFALAAADGGILLCPDARLFHDPPSSTLEVVLDDLIGAESLMRVSYRNPSRVDSKTRDLLAPMHAVLGALRDQ